MTVETGVFTFEADAVVLAGEERDRLFARAVADDPEWGRYEQRAGRVLPVVALHPVGGRPNATSEGEFLRQIHDAFRRELRLVRDEVALAGAGLGAQLRINCLTLCRGLHHHHSSEDAQLYPQLDQQFPELAPVLRRLRAEHEAIATLLEELQVLIAAADVDPHRVLAGVDRIVAELEAHLDFEEEQLIPVLDAAGL